MTDRPARVLVVDDVETGRDILTSRLQQQGHVADVAKDGEEALAMLEAVDYDLVLLDIMMPKLDGYAVLAHVKADARVRHIPIIMISALEEVESVVRCLQMGADDYVTKPFNAVLLRARVESCLAKKRLHDQEQAYAQASTKLSPSGWPRPPPRAGPRASRLSGGSTSSPPSPKCPWPSTRPWRWTLS
jgi:adenylate cyclase